MPSPKKTAADLYLLGIGIGDVKQITGETLDVLKRSRVVLHLSTKHTGLRRINPNTRDLNFLYWTGEPYEKVYARLRREVIDEMARGPGVALVTYGHPLVFDTVNLRLLAWARRRGLKVLVLPAVSCLDTLCIDLEIDYGNGLQMLDAQQMVEWALPVNPALETLIMQIGNFRTENTCYEFDWEKGHFQPLVEHLLRFYPPDHRVTIVFSSNGAAPAELTRTELRRLDSRRRRIFPGTTLYIPATAR